MLHLNLSMNFWMEFWKMKRFLQLILHMSLQLLHVMLQNFCMLNWTFNIMILDTTFPLMTLRKIFIYIMTVLSNDIFDDDISKASSFDYEDSSNVSEFFSLLLSNLISSPSFMVISFFLSFMKFIKKKFYLQSQVLNHVSNTSSWILVTFSET